MITVELPLVIGTARKLNLDVNLVLKVVSTYVDSVWDDDFLDKFVFQQNKKSE